jgi:hypothetical protein
LGIVVGIPVWAFCWFWPMIGNGRVAYSGVDYVLHSAGAVGAFFYTGLFVGVVVLTFASIEIRRYRQQRLV